MCKIQTEVFKHEVPHGATEFSFFCQIEMAMMQTVAIFVDFLTEIELNKSTKLLYIFRYFNKIKIENFAEQQMEMMYRVPGLSFIWIWSPRIFQFSYSPMSNSLTSENTERGFAHRIFDKLCPQMDDI